MYIYKSLNVKHPVFILMNHYLERNFLLIVHRYKVYNYLECSQAKNGNKQKKERILIISQKYHYYICITHLYQFINSFVYHSI